ncbi:TetR/AcrR family transcriptional regulator [Amycolatopsis aidingensis]|uniref:TetR/AcrR family transcriptional regulator n=1 Tax=Amycolatopsis aidingensis TaxID=2842453 RepID=UPI001C0D040E|nr:TetR/AcrR family transcriptional regulator [Amycolatopsis aidingensis]
MAKAYHHGDLHNALLDAAESLVRERGAHGWSLREASSRLGVSPSAAYHHFASREMLVRSLSARVLAGLGRLLTDAVDNAPGRDADPLARLSAWSVGYVRWAVTDPAVAQLALGAPGDRPAVSPHPHDVLAAELDRLVEVGHLPARNRPGAEFLVWSSVHGFVMLILDGLIRVEDDADIDVHCDRIARAVLNGVSVERVAARPVLRSAHTERLARPGTGGNVKEAPADER